MKAFEEKLIYSRGSRILVDKRLAENFDFEWHYHQAFELTLILKGEGQRFVGDSIEVYREGDLIFLPPGLPHSWKSAESSKSNEAIYIQFSTDCLGSETFALADFRELSELTQSFQAFSFSCGRKYRTLFQKCLYSRGVERVLIFLDLLKKLSTENKDQLSSLQFRAKKDGHSKELMDLVMQLLTSKVNIQVPEVASRLNMSESTFRRFIKKTTGRSFIDFSNMVQISEACQLLMESKLSISEIALECGYRNLSHFNRKFREYKKSTPREYRRSFED